MQPSFRYAAARYAAAAALVAGIVMGTACTLPPLRGEMEIGRDPYAVFVGEGSGGTDLYAVRPNGGVAIALTFSPVAESSPAMAPDGGSVAFIRTAPDAPPGVWLINLLSGTDREIPFPRTASITPRRLGWSADGSVLYIDTESGIWRAAVPPTGDEAAEIAAGELAAADSALAIGLGAPVFARAAPCDTIPDALCATAAAGASVLARGAAHAARWGSDSVAYVRNRTIEVRPLGPGRPRVVEITPGRGVVGGVTYFEGAVGQGGQ